MYVLLASSHLFYVHAHRVHSCHSLQMVLADMKAGLGKKEAMKSLLQLEEQLSALESTVRVMDGGFKHSNKVYIYV